MVCYLCREKNWFTISCCFHIDFLNFLCPFYLHYKYPHIAFLHSDDFLLMTDEYQTKSFEKMNMLLTTIFELCITKYLSDLTRI